MNEIVDVLVIDDDDLTAEIVERALQKLNIGYRLVTACDGREGLERLRATDGSQIKRPYIILLDLNMPRMNGFEFLEEMRGDRAIRDSVVFVLSTSDADSDRARAYHELVAGYMVKSAIGPQFSRLGALLKNYAEAVSLP